MASFFLCMQNPEFVDLDNLIEETLQFAENQEIDSTDNLEDSKVFYWHGTEDPSIYPYSGKNVENFYKAFNVDLKAELEMVAGHGFPTVDYGAECTETAAPFINKCGYSGVYLGLSHIYDDIKEAGSDVDISAGQLLEFDQNEFVPEGAPNDFVQEGGYVYVPSKCIDGEVLCKVHFAFHGCGMGRENIGDELVKNAGYLEIAELNNIVTVFPQTAPNEDKENPMGCWDVWGLDDPRKYVTKSGAQISAVMNMIQRVLGKY